MLHRTHALRYIFIRIAVPVLAILAVYLPLEVAARIYKGEFRLIDFRDHPLDLLRSAYPAEFSRELGWIPREGSHPRNVWNTKVTILPGGVRSNGSECNANREIILAVGDSFTFGDEVSDSETWPAILAKLSNRCVVNGGVFGYGVDQTFLRMKQLVRRHKPRLVVFSFIASDILRCELSERTGAPKPYFSLAEGRLTLNTEHIAKSSRRLRPLGWSFLLHTLMLRAFPDLWLSGSVWREQRVHSQGVAVTCRIFDALESYARAAGVKVVVLVQYLQYDFSEFRAPHLSTVVAHIKQGSLTLIDLWQPLTELKQSDRPRFEKMWTVHMTREGNRFVASQIWRAIAARLQLGRFESFSVPGLVVLDRGVQSPTCDAPFRLSSPFCCAASRSIEGTEQIGVKMYAKGIVLDLVVLRFSLTSRIDWGHLRKREKSYAKGRSAVATA